MPISEGMNDFAAIVPVHAAAMMRVAAAFVGPAEAEDAAQEAALHAWQSWSTLRDVNAVRPWLLQITVNVCRHWQRGIKGQQQARMQSLPEDEESPAFLAVLNTDPVPAITPGRSISTQPSMRSRVICERWWSCAFTQVLTPPRLGRRSASLLGRCARGSIAPCCSCTSVSCHPHPVSHPQRRARITIRRVLMSEEPNSRNQHDQPAHEVGPDIPFRRS